MIEKKSWEEFRENGLLFIVNQFLHVFGYALVYELDDNKKIKEVYPARVKFRGFGQEQIIQGYKQISKYIKDNAKELEKESLE
ncbi:hypothetical protein [Clostridium botulinum]|uniref:hypothetical protein n=1 Tax=Clostridium botulinum TaxID=1491 RepID=UPI001C9BAB55|nr:hypothetical protein [Clostridium botulinum]MBY6842703.1 hypothetical protein [Clostridium botulinum]